MPCEEECIGFIKQRIRSVLNGPKASSDSYIAYLRSLGMVIGDETQIYSPKKCLIDTTRPWMIEIGKNVQITEDVTILTHGYDWSVFKGLHGDVLGSAGHVFISDNVFNGTRTTILKGVTIGSNVVIGANSLINKDVPDNCVVVGNPQRVVCDIDTYLEKRRAAQIQEAADLYDCRRRNSPEGKRGEVPSKEMFREFFWLFESREADGFAVEEFENVMSLCGTYDKSVERFNQTSRAFSSFESFLEKMESMRS